MRAPDFPGPAFVSESVSRETESGGTVKVSDLKLPKRAKVILHGKPNPVVASAVAPVVEEEAPEVAAAPAAEPAKGKKKK